MKRSDDYLLHFSGDKKNDGGNKYDPALVLAYDCKTRRWNMQLPGSFVHQAVMN